MDEIKKRGQEIEKVVGNIFNELDEVDKISKIKAINIKFHTDYLSILFDKSMMHYHNILKNAYIN